MMILPFQLFFIFCSSSASSPSGSTSSSRSSSSGSSPRCSPSGSSSSSGSPSSSSPSGGSPSGSSPSGSPSPSSFSHFVTSFQYNRTWYNAITTKVVYKLTCFSTYIQSKLQQNNWFFSLLTTYKYLLYQFCYKHTCTGTEVAEPNS